MEVDVAYLKTFLALMLRSQQTYLYIKMWHLGLLKLHWALYIAHTAETWSVTTILFQELREKKPLGRLGHRIEETYKIIMDK